MLAPAPEQKLVLQIEEIWNERQRSFGNGRTMRNLFEECLVLPAKRIAGMSKFSEEDPMILNIEDIPER